jgi:hypothetical protein
MVTDTSWDDHNEARNALHSIVSDPAYGVAALSSSQTMANLLKDLLPDAPREASVLVGAAEAGVAGNLQDHISQGMDVGTASALVAGSFASRTPFKPDACNWAVNEVAVALGLNPYGGSAPRATPQPGGAETLAPPPGSAGSGFQPGGFQPGGVPPGGVPPGGVPPGGVPQGGFQPGGFQPGGVPQGAGQYGGFQPSGYQRAPVAAKTNGLAIASLVLGIVWVAWLGSAAALILGLVALRQIKARNQGGRGLAIAGIVLGALGLAWLLVVIIVAAAQPGT